MTRSREQLRNHYEVEKALANKLKNAPREERPAIYLKMYEELFAKVSDHPRLVRRADPAATERVVQRCLKLLKGHLRSSTVFLEFGPGDCRLAFEVCKHVCKVYAVDISKQMGDIPNLPSNFEFITYDGYQLSLPDQSVDVIFSNQLIEHIHPDDIGLHFLIAKRLLRSGGRYIFTTPYRFTGPHDISRHFSDEAEGFHLKEWTYGEIVQVLKDTGYSAWRIYRFAKGVPLRMPKTVILGMERINAFLSRDRKQKFSRIFIPGIIISATK